MPPIVEIPETTADLAVRQEGGEAVLTWSYPQLTRAGRQLVDLGRIEVWKLNVPPGQEQVGSGASGVELRRQLMLGRGRLLERLEGPMLQAATRGSKLELRDSLPPVEAGQTQPTFWYAVRTRRRDGTPSALSNIASWQVKTVPPAVGNLQVTPEPTGISLAWQAVEGASYQVERREAGTLAWGAVALGIPAPSYRDTTAGLNKTWVYRVRAVIEQVWGPPGPEASVPYPDIYPPHLVQNLICLPEGDAVHLSWDPDPEPGVLYRVFRKQGALWIHLIDDGREPQFTDGTTPAGEAEYAVKVVDAVGNESDPAYCTVRGAR
ncbi:MAG TPA: fibronectin type III domain-containing protein [Thermoanaerobaculaceae bacterium]|nr:fibronectin type III domain-containing protein [Thermoanaerobaculaceae bacterium]HPS78093.1 fibronectin type III domain-containing protein [Thermoanaerobaculaceae bacterium]